jgi:hypothetical protein
LPNDLATYDGSVYLINGNLFKQNFDASGNLTHLSKIGNEELSSDTTI